MSNTVTTLGSFTDEPVSMDDLDKRLERSGLFMVYREVYGENLQPRIDIESKAGSDNIHKTAYIDRILVPKPQLIEAGWRGGIIGVEGKKSGMKIGKAVCQAMDYTRCVWTLPDRHVHVMAKWIFVWPADIEKCDLGSIMANFRIGTAGPFKDGFEMFTDSTCAIRWSSITGIEHARTPVMGGKFGSR
jgi:hypothetical protein